eukprot:CAMPEP_0203887042 /NCGR_PEP_ID=MMETSP0359-20131031/30792_1 /ASSEMBLY_ACC=CAM_ASM_000338 /TAXON_ID=268821 /ORGANISM="Scrippsiella Hangoei, Strain SHTV-5" /LENGTH=184 /DNA_ID=CAMNT_0050807979 /DNA_START=43 /DNA_END=597 /DNA_ORIENTATION=+
MAVAGPDGVAPDRFAIKLNVLLVVVLLDCLCGGFADHLWDPSHLNLNIVLFVVPILLHLLMLLIFFLLVGHTFLLKYGLLLEMWSEFKGVFIFSFLRFCVLLAARVPRFVAAMYGWKPAEFWDNPLFHMLFFLNNITTVVHDAWLLRKCHSLARVRFYKPQLWQKQKRQTSSRTTAPGASSVLS